MVVVTHGVIPLPRRGTFERYPLLRSYMQPPATVVCTSCGLVNSKNQAFCVACGGTLTGSLVGWFDVALWLRSRAALFPEKVAYVHARSAFAAVESVMLAHRLPWVASASAYALDGSIIYRGFDVAVMLDQFPEEEVLL